MFVIDCVFPRTPCQLKIDFTKDGNVDIKSSTSTGLRWYFRCEYATAYKALVVVDIQLLSY